MAKPGKKAELDADGIALTQKKNEPEKSESPKAELDKADLSVQPDNKAQLDKDGMSFFKKIQQTISHSGESSKKTTEEQAGEPAFSRQALPRWAIPSAIALCAVLVLGSALGGFFWYKAKSAARHAKKTAPAIMQPLKAVVNEGEILLDPFMVMYEPRNESKAGILVAQMSLRVNPKTAANVKNKLYEIRSVLNEDLAKNALVYTQFELVEMMKEHLRLYDVADITFVRFDLR